MSYSEKELGVPAELFASRGERAERSCSFGSDSKSHAKALTLRVLTICLPNFLFWGVGGGRINPFYETCPVCEYKKMAQADLPCPVLSYRPYTLL